MQRSRMNMALIFKISLLAVITVLMVLIPLSLNHIRSLAEEEEIQGRLRSVGKLMATELFTNELASESAARQYIFFQAAQSIDDAILFTAVYPGGKDNNIAVVNRERFPKHLSGSDWDLIKQFVEQHKDPMVRYVSVTLPQNRELLIGYSIASIVKMREKRQLQAVGQGLILILFAIIASSFLAILLTRPIRDLNMGMSKVAKGDLSVRLKKRSRDEIGKLTQGFNQMVTDLQENVLERQRMSNELDVARRIQQKLLPQSEPEIGGLDISGICLTYSEVGGDYYDYITLGDGRLAVIVGDVSGHGVSSGLLAAEVQGCLRNQLQIDSNPEKVMTAVNRAVRASPGQMMTLCYALLDPKNNLAIIASAGHWSPYHYIAKENLLKEVYLSDTIAPALGALPASEYPYTQVSLETGDVLVFYSDGIVEASNINDEFFGEVRFQDALKQHASKNAKQIRDAILDEVRRFRGKAPQNDDIALVIVKFGTVHRFGNTF